MLEFLRSGGRITPDLVSYRNISLPRARFRDRDLGGLGYLVKLADHGSRVEVEDGAFVATEPNGLRFEASATALVDTLCMLVERFVDEEYAWLEAEGRVVIDVGANIGDSVLYFATRGAVHVYGYEPDGTAFAAATRNLKLNRTVNAQVTRAAVGSGEQAGDVLSLGLPEVLDLARKEHPNIPIVCKIDCEGCEFDILAPAALGPLTLRQVTQVMVEYHVRSPEVLREALESVGFQVETSPGAPGVGWIRARRLD